MAANKFTKILQKNCPKIGVILAYAILEWILILLLLLNSLFSYLIQKFAKYFGLKPFCMFCSRLDHILENRKQKISHLDHICEAHMIEISKLSYCSNHQRLSESNNMCYNCSSTYALFTWISRGVSESDEEHRCSCCDEILSGKFFKPTWDVLDYIQEKASFEEVIDAGQDSDTTTQSKSLSEAGQMKHEIDQFEEKNNDPVWNLGCNEDSESVYIADMLLQNAEDMDSDRFICIELTDTEPVMVNVEGKEEGKDEYDVQDEDVEKCKKSSLNVAFSNRRMKRHSAEAEEVEGVDTSPGTLSFHRFTMHLCV